MVRLLGLNIQDNFKVGFALTSIFGIGWTRAEKIIKECKLDGSKRLKDLTEDELKEIINFIDKNYITEGELRENLAESIKRLKDIGSYRGLRHSRSLPVRGQRTRSNARTKRGKRKTVGALKKDDRAKLTVAETADNKK
ncbi:MAG: 30S ribosomal protein S13 [bacterium]|nr:30S ribosomal protein S13 [bacterium]